MSVTDMSVGTRESGLSFTRTYNSYNSSSITPLGTGWSHNFSIEAERADDGEPPNNYVRLAIDFGHSTKTFKRTVIGGQYDSLEDDGSALLSHVVDGEEEFEYIASNGDITYFKPKSTAFCATTTGSCWYYVDYIQRASGERLEFSYELPYRSAFKLRSVNSSLGWNLSILSEPGYTMVVQMVNLAEDYCPPSYEGQPYCNLSNWPKVKYTRTGDVLTAVTDTQNQIERYVYNGNYQGNALRMIGIRRPSSPTTDSITINYETSGTGVEGRVSSQVVAGVGTWHYGYGNPRTIENPAGETQKIHFGAERPDWAEDALGRRTSFLYDSSDRLIRKTRPDGSYVQFTRDARGNITESRVVAASGSGLADIVTTAAYPTSCTISEWAKCNLPTWTRDARGKQTDYTYASDGRLLTITAPASAPGQARPQQRFQYTQLEAYVKNSSGSFVANGSPVWRLSQTATCQTQAAPGCIGTSDEVVTMYSYGTAGVGNNRLLSQSALDPSGLNYVRALTYDRVGNVLAVDGPISGTADTSWSRYDSERRLVGAIGSDPDGGGSLKHAAKRFTYDVDGLLSTTEIGTVAGPTDTAWSAFSTTRKTTNEYDSAGRVAKQSLVVGSTTHAVRQVSYSVASRPVCAALRMNPAVFNSLPTSACTHSTQGSDGPDRIVRTYYNAAGQVTGQASGYGTSLQQNTVTNAYDSTSGLITSVVDANGNKTTYEYDGLARAYKTRFPNKTNGAVSSTTDYVQTNFDAYGRVGSIRKRDGRTTNFSYDDLGRLTLKNLPATSSNDVYYSYDLLGRVLSIRHGSTSGTGITNNAYNKAGAVTSTTSYGRTVTYQYDSSGRRSRTTWPDAFYVDYVYDTLSRVTQIRENGATSGAGLLATYTYDDLGRLSSLSRGNGTSSSYTYDSLSQLASLGHDLSGTSMDYSATFTYTPAAQIKSRTAINNSVYRWTGSDDIQSYSHNDLNQVTVADGATTQHDSNGNITSDGTTAYSYDSENKLTSVSGAASLSLTYDPAGRLRRTEVPGTSATRTDFLYDGSTMIAEYNNSGALTRRYVHGVGVDAPVVWYEGSGTNDRRWLHADERGSIVAISNASGVTTQSDTIIYDPYGKSSTISGSRFQYTGQMMLPEVGLYYYKARMYSSELGRFLQPDPIGYAGGMNMYAYVGGDPVNFIDPDGLCGRRAGSRIRDCDRSDYEIVGEWRYYIDDDGNFVPEWVNTGRPRTSTSVRVDDATPWREDRDLGSVTDELPSVEDLIREQAEKARTRQIAIEMCQAELSCAPEDLEQRLLELELFRSHPSQDPKNKTDIAVELMERLFGLDAGRAVLTDTFNQRCEICGGNPNNPFWEDARRVVERERVWGRSLPPPRSK